MNRSEDLKDRYKDWVLFKRVLVHLRPYASWVTIAIILLLAVLLFFVTIESV